MPHFCLLETNVDATFIPLNCHLWMNSKAPIHVAFNLYSISICYMYNKTRLINSGTGRSQQILVNQIFQF